MTRSGRSTRRLLVATATIGLIAAACSGDDASERTEADPDLSRPEPMGESRTRRAPAPAPPSVEATIPPVTTGAEEPPPSDDPGPEAPPEEPPTGATIEVFGTFAGDEDVEGLLAGFDAFTAETGVDVVYEGTFDYSLELEFRLDIGDPPDLIISPFATEPGDLEAEGVVQPLPDDIAASITERLDPTLSLPYLDDSGTVMVAAPFTTELRSLVWYSPDRFAEAGLVVPTTYDEFLALIERLAAAGGPPPLCVGIESSSATGWVYSDWVENEVLRVHGTEVYDGWVDHSILFSDPPIVDSMQAVIDLWNTEGAVLASGGTIEQTSFFDAGAPVIDGGCFMHVQGAFYASTLGLDADVFTGTPGSVDVFPLPSNGARTSIVSGAAVASLADRPEVWALLDFMTSSSFADAVNAATDAPLVFASTDVDTSLLTTYQTRMTEIVAATEVFRYDASDQMPREVGADTFWRFGTDVVAGRSSVVDAARDIDTSWPT